MKRVEKERAPSDAEIRQHLKEHGGRLSGRMSSVLGRLKLKS